MAANTGPNDDVKEVPDNDEPFPSGGGTGSSFPVRSSYVHSLRLKTGLFPWTHSWGPPTAGSPSLTAALAQGLRLQSSPDLQLPERWRKAAGRVKDDKLFNVECSVQAVGAPELIVSPSGMGVSLPQSPLPGVRVPALSPSLSHLYFASQNKAAGGSPQSTQTDQILGISSDNQHSSPELKHHVRESQDLLRAGEPRPPPHLSRTRTVKPRSTPCMSQRVQITSSSSGDRIEAVEDTSGHVADPIGDSIIDRDRLSLGKTPLYREKTLSSCCDSVYESAGSADWTLRKSTASEVSPSMGYSDIMHNDDLFGGEDLLNNNVSLSMISAQVADIHQNLSGQKTAIEDVKRSLSKLSQVIDRQSGLLQNIAGRLGERQSASGNNLGFGIWRYTSILRDTILGLCCRKLLLFQLVKAATALLALASLIVWGVVRFKPIDDQVAALEFIWTRLRYLRERLFKALRFFGEWKC